MNKGVRSLSKKTIECVRDEADDYCRHVYYGLYKEKNQQEAAELPENNNV